jgi:hypothetical protein
LVHIDQTSPRKGRTAALGLGALVPISANAGVRSPKESSTLSKLLASKVEKTDREMILRLLAEEEQRETTAEWQRMMTNSVPLP